MNPYDIAATIFAVFGLVGLGAAARSYNKATKGITSRDTWKSEAQAQTARAERLQKDVDSLSARVVRFEAEISTLRDMVTGKAAIEALAKLSAAQHQETMATLLALPGMIERQAS